MTDVLVGTCGYGRYDPPEGWKETYESKLHAYSAAYPAVELNRTFYELPQVSTAERWREEVVEDFVFAVKAWQGMTHQWASPTWNGHRDAVDEDEVDTDDLGYLQPTAAVRDAWRRTVARADALAAPVILLQTPPSFDATDVHEADLRDLLGSVDRGDPGNGVERVVAWEPRGTWREQPERVAAVCDDLDLVHVVDRSRGEEPASDGPVTYTRCHGRNDPRNDYEYDYDADELDDLAGTLADVAADRDAAYCFFNNYAMYEDAAALAERV